MRESDITRNFAFATIIITAVILHGSLYPYNFRVPLGPIGPFQALLETWNSPPTSFGDLVANILLYIPFGLFGVLALKTSRKILAITVAGLLLCTTVELTQFYDAGRVTNMSDVCLNTFGTWIGALCGGLVSSRSQSNVLNALALRPVQSVLLIAMLGYRLFPYVPTIDLHKYWHSLKPIVVALSITPFATFHYFALWLTTDYLIANIGGMRRSGLFIPIFVATIFFAKVLIVNQILTLSEMVGAGFAYIAWILVLRPAGAPAWVAAAVLCSTIVVLRLEPFNFRPSTTSFGWWPFRSYLSGSLDINIQTFFEKTFLYGSLLWLGTKMGLHHWKATALVSCLLLVTSIAETHLPGRSAEITDTVMAVMIGIIFAAMSSLAGDGKAKAKAVARTSSAIV